MKMLFFKPRPKPAEIIPPPPDFEEELKEKPKFFDEFIKKPKSETFTEDERGVSGCCLRTEKI